MSYLSVKGRLVNCRLPGSGLTCRAKTPPGASSAMQASVQIETTLTSANSIVVIRVMSISAGRMAVSRASRTLLIPKSTGNLPNGAKDNQVGCAPSSRDLMWSDQTNLEYNQSKHHRANSNVFTVSFP